MIRIITMLCISLLTAEDISSQFDVLYPRIISVKGKYVYEFTPKEVDIEVSLSNTNRLTKSIKTIDKTIEGIQQYFTSKSISLNKIDVKNDPMMCNLSYKTIHFRNINMDEYSSIYPYLQNHQYVSSSRGISKRITLDDNKLAVYKIAFHECIKNAKGKAEQIAKFSNQKIEGVHNISCYNFFKIKDNNDEIRSSFDLKKEIEVVTIPFHLDLDFKIIEENMLPNTLQYPNSLRIGATGFKDGITPSGYFSFVYELKDYMNGDIDDEYRKMKEKFEKSLIQMGIKKQNIEVKINSYDYQRFKTRYKVVLENENEVKKAFEILQQNENLSELRFNMDNSKKIYSDELNNYLTNKAFENAADRLELIKKILNIDKFELLKVYDSDINHTSLNKSYNELTQRSIMAVYSKKIYLNYKFEFNK